MPLCTRLERRGDRGAPPEAYVRKDCASSRHWSARATPPFENEHSSSNSWVESRRQDFGLRLASPIFDLFPIASAPSDTNQHTYTFEHLDKGSQIISATCLIVLGEKGLSSWLTHTGSHNLFLNVEAQQASSFMLPLMQGTPFQTQSIFLKKPPHTSFHLNHSEQLNNLTEAPILRGLFFSIFWNHITCLEYYLPQSKYIVTARATMSLSPPNFSLFWLWNNHSSFPQFSSSQPLLPSSNTDSTETKESLNF